MAVTINADTSNGLVLTPDTSGEISFQSNGTTVAGINSTGWTGDGSQLTGVVSGLQINSTVQTASFTASSNTGYFVNTSSSAVTVTLPASPSAGDQVKLIDYNGSFATNNLTINPNSNNLIGQSGNKILDGNRETLTLTYIDSTEGWVTTDGYTSSTPALGNPPYSVEYLVVAGGGGGGASDGASGAGGAGGLKTGTFTANPATAYTATVGGGGAGRGSFGTGNNGSASSISGSGLTTISTVGGGGGGGGTGAGQTGAAGGSGGGGCYGGAAGGAGTSGQGFAGGAGGAQSGAHGTGGGGGAGAVGATGSTTKGGDGGIGVSSSITGSATYYAGGGGGGNQTNGYTTASGGSGGGGRGNGTSGAAQDGTANTGGGAGGNLPLGSIGANTRSGGSGVVILRMLTSDYSGTTTGSPTVTTDGSYTVLKYTGTGTYTG